MCNNKIWEAKYADLVEEIEENGFMVDFVTVEVGACGFVQYDSFHRLNNLLGASQKDLLNHLVEVTKVTIKNSFHIWTLRNCWFDHSEDTVSVWLSLSPLLNFYFSKLAMSLLNVYVKVLSGIQPCIYSRTQPLNRRIGIWCLCPVAE